MGCLQSQQNKRSSSYSSSFNDIGAQSQEQKLPVTEVQRPPDPPPQRQVPPQPKSNLTLADLEFAGQDGETLVKAPGLIGGQQFNIRDCKNWKIYVCDYLDSCTIDDWTDCTIFIGPTTNSIFVRDCSGLKIVAACKQYRTRDVKDSDFLLYSVTDPSIERTTNVRVGCFNFFYFALAGQFEQSGLNPWNNEWATVYDFNNSNKFGQSTNYSILPAGEAANLIEPLEGKVDFLSPGEQSMGFVVPPTTFESGNDQAFVILFSLVIDQIGHELVKQAIAAGLQVVQTKMSRHLNVEQLTSLFRLHNAWNRVINTAFNKDILGIHFSGAQSIQKVSDILTKLMPSNPDAQPVYYIYPTLEATKMNANNFFKIWKVKV